MDVQRIAAFSTGFIGGNLASVTLCDAHAAVEQMQAIAAKVGLSETAFAARAGSDWRVRYFAPETEVPVCGHATIALGAALAVAYGDGTFALRLNEARITVEGRRTGPTLAGALQSPATRSAPADRQLVDDILAPASACRARRGSCDWPRSPLGVEPNGR